jgi:hypothetical protein
MKVQQHAGGIAIRCDRPFSRHAINVDAFEFNIFGDGPDGADFLDALPPFLPADRARLRTQQGAHGVDLALAHGCSSLRRGQASAQVRTFAKAEREQKATIL